jgi:hypothetical protein
MNLISTVVEALSPLRHYRPPSLLLPLTTTSFPYRELAGSFLLSPPVSLCQIGAWTKSLAKSLGRL